MRPAPLVQRIAAWLIRGSCRRLPVEAGAERYLEWSAEVHAILEDRSVRPGLRRAMQALRYSAGTWRATRHLRPPRGGPGDARAPAWRDGAMRARLANLAVRATAGVIVWLAVHFTTIALGRAFPADHAWTGLFAAGVPGCIALLCLDDIARADQVRYLPKWAWALICFIQMPAGGIAYVSLGRVRTARPAPAESARS
jgi:hypothetical protein